MYEKVNKNARILLVALIIPQCAFLLFQFVLSDQIESIVIAETTLVILDVMIIFIWQLIAKKKSWACLIGSPLHMILQSIMIILFTR